MAISDLKNANAFTVDGHRLVANLERRLDVLVGERLVGWLAGEILLVHRKQLFALLVVDIDSDDDVTLTIDRRIRDRHYVAQEVAYAVTSVCALSKMYGGGGRRGLYNSRQAFHMPEIVTYYVQQHRNQSSFLGQDSQ